TKASSPPKAETPTNESASSSPEMQFQIRVGETVASICRECLLRHGRLCCRELSIEARELAQCFAISPADKKDQDTQMVMALRNICSGDDAKQQPGDSRGLVIAERESPFTTLIAARVHRKESAQNEQLRIKISELELEIR